MRHLNPRASVSKVHEAEHADVGCYLTGLLFQELVQLTQKMQTATQSERESMTGKLTQRKQEKSRVKRHLGRYYEMKDSNRK